MDIKGLFLEHIPLIRKNWMILSLGILGLIFFAYGLIGLFSTNKTGAEGIIFESNSVKQTQVEVKTILVDVAGAVVRPGVYKLPQESRVQDGLIAAGGLSAQADREYIAKNINLAIKLSDGVKIYIPAVGQAVGDASVPNTSSGGIVISGLININSASESDLDTLPGIGPVTAKKIISGRPYNSVDDLINKKIVGTKVFEQIKDKITIY
jgi:competence protein ComEA